MKQMLQVDACHVFLSSKNVTVQKKFEKDLILVGTSLNVEQDLSDSEVSYSSKEDSYVSFVYNNNKEVEVKDCAIDEKFKPVSILNEDKVKYYLAVPMYNNIGKVGVVVVENYNDSVVSEEDKELLSVIAKLFATSMTLEKLTKEMRAAAKLLEFEHAAYLRDQIEKIKNS